MRSILVIVSVLTVFHLSFGQTGTIGSPGVKDYASSILADNSGNSYIGGSSNNSVLLLKRNSLNETLWSNTIPLPTGTYYGIEICDILLVGDTLFGCGYLKDPANDYIKGSTYFKIDANTGTCYWLKYDFTSDTYFSSIQYYQGKLVMSGSKVSYPYVGQYDGKVVGVTSDQGNMLWETPIFGIKFTATSIDSQDDFHASSTIENGKMYLTGRSFVGNNTTNMRCTLIGIDVDNNGAIFLSKYLMFNTATDFSRVYGTSIQRDGTELIIGFFGDYFCTSCSNFRTGLLKCDLSGNVIWSKYYDINGGVTDEYNKNVNITPDGYVIYGHATLGTEKKITLLKTNKQGDFLLGKMIGQNGQNFSSYNPGLYSVASTADFQNGMHYFAGNKYQLMPNDCDIFCLKANNTTLEGENPCFTYQNFTVSTMNIAPYSGDVITVPSVYPITYSTVSSEATVNVTTCPPITIDQQHTEGCGNDTILLSVTGLSSPQFNWSNGGTGNPIVVTSLDTLIVNIYDQTNCCSYQDTVIPSFQTNTGALIVELPADTLACLQPNGNIQINAVVTTGQTGVSYSWNSGQNTPSIVVDSSGTYIVTASTDCASGKDTIVVEINHFPQVDLGPDSQICSSQFPYIVNPVSTDVDSWLWSTGETTPTVTINGMETISVDVSNECGTDSDILAITEQLSPTVSVISPIDTCLNENQSLLVSVTVTNATNINWSNGQSGIEIVVHQSGIYNVVVSSSCGTDSASANITISHPITQKLPDTISSCEGFVLLSDYIPSVYDIMSSDIDLTDMYVEESGWIFCLAETACGTYSDSIYAEINGSDLLFLENTFTPNNDKVNDKFELMVPELKIVSVEIFNRWGEVIYSEKGSFSGWDGTDDGQLCPDGVYQVQLIYADCNGLDHQFNGHVNLLK